MLFETFLNGFAAISFDPRDEKLYMVGEEHIKIVNPFTDTAITTFEYGTVFTDLQAGSQVVFDTISNKLFCYNLKFRTVHYFDFPSRTWIEKSRGTRTQTALWFHNKYYSGPDSTLYIFGGYGQHRYYNLVQRYDLLSDQWDTVRTGGDIFHPRQHAALGKYGDTLYILGGFGSRAGDQILKPQHYKDLMAFSLKDQRFMKKYEFQAPLRDIDFAHSMVIDPANKSYYVLASTIYEYDTYLQLLKGNLEGRELIMLGDKMPYFFHNENSYSDLYFSKTVGKLISTTLLARPEDNETDIKVYTISYPPHISETETVESNRIPGKAIVRILSILMATAFLAILIWYFRKKAARTGRDETVRWNHDSQPDRSTTIFISGENGTRSPNSILFFGGFQIINREGVDITKKFTPLLKELFLLVFLNSVRDKGISVEKMTELLWFSMDAKSAKNNRAVNIAKLKNLLVDIDGCSLSRKTGYWRIEFYDTLLYNDYWSCIKTINQPELLPKDQLQKFICLIKTGPLLGNANYEWLDEFKSECSNMVIDTLMKYSNQIKIETDPELILGLSDAILIFDMLHEEAINLKCRALTVLGKHSLAKNSFTKFVRNYETLYDERYDKSFSDIVRS
jgi:two-component SAPR family response regulator